MPKRNEKEKSRISRACDRCQHRKLACDTDKHSCQPCRKAGTWCTATDHLTGVPAYRGQYNYLERMVEKQHGDIQRLLDCLRALGRDMPYFEYRDSETQRYEAWKYVRSIEPNRPWDKEDKQANLTMDSVIQDEATEGLETPYLPGMYEVVEDTMADSPGPSTSSTQSTFIHPPSLGYPLNNSFSPHISIQTTQEFQADFTDYNQAAAFTTDYCNFEEGLSHSSDLDYDVNRARM